MDVGNWGGDNEVFAVEPQAPEIVRARALDPEGGLAPGCKSGESQTISFCTEVPGELLVSMGSFIAQHPNWDQYRLFQAALAGFLVQNGLGSREVTRCYLANLFPSQGDFRSP